MYHVIDTDTGAIHTRLVNRRRAADIAKGLNSAYGAPRYTVRRQSGAYASQTELLAGYMRHLNRQLSA